MINASRMIGISAVAVSVVVAVMFIAPSTTPTANAKTEMSTLGAPSHVQLTVSDLIASMAWYAKIGFSPITGPETRPDSILYLSDGQIVLSLVKGSAPSPLLVFRADNLRALRDSLDELEIASGFTLRGPTYAELQLTSPSGVPISVRLATEQDSIEMKSTPNPVCGPIGELSISTPSMPNERTFWELLGWQQVDANDIPYPFTVMSDGKVKIGIHQGLDLPGLAITYFSSDAEERVQRLSAMGMTFEPDMVSEATKHENAVLKSPDGQLVFVFKDPKAK
jgi:hypothetical protein